MQTRTAKRTALAVTTGAVLGLAAFGAPGANLAQAGQVGAMIWQAKNPVARVADAPQLDDGAIAYIYLQTNLFEVEVAELGRSAGASDGVKQLAQMVADDHRGVIRASKTFCRGTASSRSRRLLRRRPSRNTRLCSQTFGPARVQISTRLPSCSRRAIIAPSSRRCATRSFRRCETKRLQLI